MSERREQFGLEGAPGGTGVAGDPYRGDVVSLRVQRVALAASLVARLRAVGERLWVLGPAALVMVGLDAALALPAWARVALGACFLALCARVLVGIVRPGRAVRMTAMRAARLIEDRLGLRDNPIVNALQLRAALAGGDALTTALAERVMDHGVEVAEKIEQTRVVDGRGATRAWGKVLGATVLVAASLFVMPRVWGAGVVRYVDPFAGHAPWSPTVFGVVVSPAEVLVGDAARVEVRVSGAIPEGVALVFVDGAGAPIDRASMGAIFERTGSADADASAERATRYEITLHDLREPVRFYPEAETGRGSVVEIVPLDKPRLVAATLVVHPPAYTGLPATTERVDLAGRSAGPRPVLRGSTIELTAVGSVELGEVDRSTATITGEVDLLGTSVRQRVVASDAGAQTLSMRLVSRSGLRGDELVRVELEVMEDAPPRVSVRAPASPGERAAVLAGRGIPVVATAEDDVRVEGLDVEWMVTRVERETATGSERVPLDTGRRTRTRWEGQRTLDTGAMDIEAGDRIELWIEALDGRGDAFGGAQATRVGPIEIDVIDEREFRRRSLERLGVDDVVGAYEELAKGARELAGLASEAAAASERAEQGRGSKPDAQRAGEAVAQKREALERAVRQRLASEPLVDFDEEMRGALERLLERLQSFEGPGEGEGDGRQASERTERNAELADLAAREAALGLEAPSERLRMAADLRRQLDRLDRIAKAQRALADRLAETDSLGADAARSLADDQLELMAQTDRVCVRLEELGDRAAHELPGVEVLAGKELELGEARRRAQESIEAAREIASAPGVGLSDELARESMREAADLALTDLYFSTDPTLDAVREFGDAVEKGGLRRIDDPGALDVSQRTRDEIDRALEAVRQIGALLDDVRERVRSFGVRRSAHAPMRLPPALLGVVMALGASDEGPGIDREVTPENVDEVDLESGTVDERFVRALEVARVRLAALEVRLREAHEAAGPRLPVMGASAIELSQRVRASEIAETMYDAEWALREADLTPARERALLAAERLEALYEEASEGEGQCSAGEDSPLQLMNPGPSQSDGQDQQGGSSGGESGSSGTSSGGGGGGGAGGGGSSDSGSLPNALDVLSRSRGSGASEGEREARSGSREDGGGASGDNPGADPADRGGFERAGSLPDQAEGEGGSSDGGDRGADASSGGAEGGGDSGAQGEHGAGDPNLADRARRFNENLYSEPVTLDRPVEGEGGEEGGQRIEADAIRLEGDPVGRENGLRALLARSGMDAAEVESVFERVPAGYRDVVAAYLLRIARDEGSTGDATDGESE